LDRIDQSVKNRIQEMLQMEQKGFLLLIEVNNLPMITAIYDQSIIDQMMYDLTNLINAVFGETSLVVRNGNEYFSVVINGTDKQEVKERTTELYQSLQFFGSKLDNVPLHIMITVGGSEITTETKTVEDVYNKAYIALKNLNEVSNKYYFTYEETLIEKNKLKHDMVLAHALKKAIVEKKLRLAFQPIINSKTGGIEYHESLLRLINDEGKVISIGPFIPVAERMGLINLIDELVLEMVAEELKRSPNITLAFNISGLAIDNDNILNKARELLQDQGVASRAIVELTETAAQKNLGKSAFFVASLQEMGCKVALDDFGSGHTSFRQLKALPVDIIKIDGAFIKDIVNSADNRLFVKTLLNISRGFGLKAVAEYVENGEIAKLLMELKVDYLQGNYFCPAVNYRSWATE
jgi:EAL domain-containing protein (putative c-di-GMP-specific phosphodiesterase class I)/GGDEF domain-containing protein